MRMHHCGVCHAQLSVHRTTGAYAYGSYAGLKVEHGSSHKYGAIHTLVDAAKVLIGSGHTRSQDFNGSPT
jgi:hypothetical protein